MRLWNSSKVSSSSRFSRKARALGVFALRVLVVGGWFVLAVLFVALLSGCFDGHQIPNPSLLRQVQSESAR